MSSAESIEFYDGKAFEGRSSFVKSCTSLDFWNEYHEYAVKVSMLTNGRCLPDDLIRLSPLVWKYDVLTERERERERERVKMLSIKECKVVIGYTASTMRFPSRASESVSRKLKGRDLDITVVSI